MFAAALVAWLVAFLGDVTVDGVRRGVLGTPEHRALTMAMRLAVDASLSNVPVQSREPLAAALRERFVEPPAVMLDGKTRVRTGILRAIQAQIAPLSDPALTLTGQSFFEELGVDAAQIRDELAEIVIRSIEQVGPGFPALTPLIAQLNADTIIERVDAVAEMISAARRESDEQAASRSSGHRSSPSGSSDSSALDVDRIEQLTDALLHVPSVADDESRQAIFDLLPDRLRHSMPRSRHPRVQVLQMIRTSTNYAGGFRAMLRAVRIVEGDSLAMKQLDDLILSFDGAQGEITALPREGWPND